ncbi:transmembrane protein 273 isoform X1 [Saccopteryx bilineata]|uniref:transmembrane protein 273 isoform X1 n=1 Tax=Saccopteryx bilineata TaxID=59482 RepID=UPI00338EF955
MGLVASRLRPLLFLLDVGGAQVLATGKSAEAETDIRYALIGMALGVAISAGFLALKVCVIKKHLFDNDSSDLRNTTPGVKDTTALKKRVTRLHYNFSERASDPLFKPATLSIKPVTVAFNQHLWAQASNYGVMSMIPRSSQRPCAQAEMHQ